jgi:hypothetical protein
MRMFVFILPKNAKTSGVNSAKDLPLRESFGWKGTDMEDSDPML